MKSLYLLLTDSCNMMCKFCYKGEVTRNSDGSKMSPDSAHDAIQSMSAGGLIDLDDRDTRIYFWGGEPFVCWDTIKATLERYPQIHFCTNTNGVAINEDVAKELEKHKYHLHLTLSLSSSYDRFDGVADACNSLAPIVKLVAESKGAWSVNLVALKPERLYEDFKYLYFEKGITNILVDLPTHVAMTEELKKAFVENYVKILSEFSISEYKSTKLAICDNVLWEYLGENYKLKRHRYCGSGFLRLLIDFRGDVYPCDGFYNVKRCCLGNIYSHVDTGRLHAFENLNAHPEKLYIHCKECDIYGWCPRAKCLGLNIEVTGNMFKPDPRWCEINRTLVEVSKEYVKVLEARKMAGVKHEGSNN